LGLIYSDVNSGAPGEGIALDRVAEIFVNGGDGGGGGRQGEEEKNQGAQCQWQVRELGLGVHQGVFLLFGTGRFSNQTGWKFVV
jgi:hypothetical protein